MDDTSRERSSDGGGTPQDGATGAAPGESPRAATAGAPAAGPATAGAPAAGPTTAGAPAAGPTTAGAPAAGPTTAGAPATEPPIAGAPAPVGETAVPDSRPETKARPAAAREVQAHVVADTTLPDEMAAAGLDAVEGDAASETDSQPAVGEGREAPERLKSIVESLLFASEKPLSAKRLQELTGERDLEKVQSAIEWLRADYADRGVVLHEVAGGYQFRTSPLNAYWIQQMLAGRPVRLTRAQLETLAIVAYRQPITRPEIDEIRGVDSAGPLKILLDRRLVRVLGKKEEPGRPLLYGTTKDFLEFFNLKDLKDLPTLREFAELSEESLAKVRALDEQKT